MYDPVLHVVLYQPEIPHNTGAVGRTCVAVGAKLWLVRPLGFRVDDYYLRRAGRRRFNPGTRASMLFLNEPVTTPKVVGPSLIVAGIAIGGQG